MKLIFAVLDVSLTMCLTRCYKTEGFLHLFYLTAYAHTSVCRREFTKKTSTIRMHVYMCDCVCVFL